MNEPWYLRHAHRVLFFGLLTSVAIVIGGALVVAQYVGGQ